MVQQIREFFNEIRQGIARLRNRYRGQFYRFLQGMWANPELNRQLQSFFGLFAIIFLVVMLSCFTILGDRLNPEPLDVGSVAQKVHDTNPFFAHVPRGILEFFVLRVSGETLRYAILPLLAVILIFIAGAYFVKDVYDLDTFGQGLRHMVSAMFGLFYPKLLVDEGEVKLEDGKTNLLNALGGPGYVLIQPGNVVQFRQIRELTNPSMSESYFLAHFEYLELPVSLEDQIGHSPSAVYETRDGILTRFRDIRYGYRIMPADDGFKRSPDQPYSYDPVALESFLFERSVDDEGLRTWQRNISFAIDGPIRAFVGEKTIDFLMAPGIDEQEVRRIIRTRVLNAQPLRKFGAELLWIDIGKIELFQFGDQINSKRIQRWAADWKGDADVTRAYGEATKRVFLEIGRAEAQAEALKSIAKSLGDVDWQDDEVSNLRRILLSRTAQFLETFLEKQPEELDCQTRTPPLNGDKEDK
ncbi:MAG: hypothetical protein K8R77_00635 [Anaerolineaceae bacterium]|nr:hypothetical protein [Anaerolineaceae bacterium]